MTGLVTGIILIALGVLAAASSIVSKRPDAQTYIDKLVPFQGWLGFLAAIWGVWIVINAVLNLNLISYAPVWWLTYAATGGVIAVLGLLLGYALLTQFIFSHSAEATRRGEQIRLSMAPYQVSLGYVAIFLGLWAIVAFFFYRGL
jgi:hypothetical protein